MCVKLWVFLCASTVMPFPDIFAGWTSEIHLKDLLLCEDFLNLSLPDESRPFSPMSSWDSIHKQSYTMAFIKPHYSYWCMCHCPYLPVFSLGGIDLVSFAFTSQDLQQCLVHYRHMTDWGMTWNLFKIYIYSWQNHKHLNNEIVVIPG